MTIIHIIETNANDQQTVEIRADNANNAVHAYMRYSTLDEAPLSIEVCGDGKVIWHYADEYCVLQAQTPSIIFATWVHRKGLY